MTDILSYYSKKLLQIDEDLTALSYIWEDLQALSNNFRTDYAKLITITQQLEQDVIKRDIPWVKNDIINFIAQRKTLLSYADELKKYGKITQKTFSDNTSIKAILVTQTNAAKIQATLLKQIATFWENKELFKKINQIVYLTNKHESSSLSSQEREKYLTQLKTYTQQLQDMLKGVGKEG